MAFILTEEQQMMVDLARDFAKKEIAPVSEKMDREAKFVPGLIKQLAELGFEHFYTFDKMQPTKHSMRVIQNV